ncbi:MAG: ABC transporter ATP-binding protein [Candidatus Magasanikbacteria bacterium]
MKTLTKKTFEIYYQHTKKYALGVFAVIFGNMMVSIIETVTPLYYRQFFNVIYEATNVGAVKGLLLGVLIKIFLLYLVSWFVWRLVEFIYTYIHTNILKELTRTCFNYIHQHSVSFFNNNFIGSLVKKAGRFTWSFESLFDTVVYNLVPAFVSLTAILIILGMKNFVFMLIILVWFVLFLLVNYLFSKFKMKYDLKRSELDSKVNGHFADTLTNHVNVKLFNGYEKEKREYVNVTGELQKMMLFTWNLSNLGFGLIGLFVIALEISLMYFAIILWERGIFTPGDFVLIQSYVVIILHKTWDFSRIIRNWYERLADAAEMTEIFVTPHEIEDRPGAKELEVKKGEIEFENVSFNYRKTRKILKKFTLVFRPGKRYALVGPSGAGKSTVIKLLLRQHDISGGKIFIDGQDIAKVKQESLWKNISFVPQDPILFHRSILENIRYGRFDATDDEVYEAARKANCHEFIANLPERYDTQVGERGIKLSGGERQRVAIARAVLRNAPILLLDEATSSLDSESEKLIQDALNTLMKGKTVIVIAHRLSTIMMSDNIIVIEGGNIVEHGSHKQLIQKKDGLYKKLWTYQAGGFIE